jgi:hypothetical protein
MARDAAALARAMQRPRRMGGMGASWLLPATVALVACGHAAGIEGAEVARATRGVRAAYEAGAYEAPGPGFYLELAESELDRAVGQLRVRDAAGARGWARRAWADAEVARLLAIEAATRGAAQHTEDEAEAISRALDAADWQPSPRRGP